MQENNENNLLFTTQEMQFLPEFMLKMVPREQWIFHRRDDNIQCLKIQNWKWKFKLIFSLRPWSRWEGLVQVKL